MPATAVVQFIGLILLSTKLYSGHDQTLRAMIPRIPGPQTYNNINMRRFRDAEWAMSDTGVERHVAFIAFLRSDYDATASNWKTAKLPHTDELPPGQYLYVRLDGEQIHFITSSKTEADHDGSSVSAAPIVTAQSFIDIELDMKHLQYCCIEQRLRTEYTGPQFRLAAGVFDLSNGSACVKKGPGDVGHERRDTIVSFKNDGQLIIETAKHRRLVLRGTAVITVGNMPADFVGDARNGNSVPHNDAWLAIVDPKTKTCTLKPDCDENVHGRSCSTSDQEQTASILPHIDGHRLGHRMDEQCSNTQWP